MTTTTDTLSRVRLQLHGVKGSDAKFTAFCPAHDDRETRSLSVGLGDDGRILLKCFAGCETARIAERLGLKMSNLFADSPRGGGGVSPPKQHCNTATRGYTLERYAADKRLDLDFLKSLGLANLSYMGAPAIRIPYLDSTGQARSTRYRIAETGDRFRWKSGDKSSLYGLWRRQEAIDAESLVLTEGESDCHTLWSHDIPAMGIPGANTWNEERDAPSFDGIPVIYIVVEPDLGGETVMGWLSRSRIRDRVKVLDLGEHKDPSALYLAVGDGFRDAMQTAMDSARPYLDIARESEVQHAAEAWALCQPIAEATDILSLAADAVASLGLTGESRNVRLMYLVLVSRLFERPASVVVKGPSSAGKSYLVERVLMLMPGHVYYALSAMSERALAYSEEPLKHRFLVIYEAAGMSGDFASYLLRSLLSEGRVRYETVERTPEGLKPRLIEREGPTGVILTTTSAKLHPENETRMLSILASDTSDQTRNVLRALATIAEHGSGDAERVDLSIWHALQDWLASGERRVIIPYAMELADLVPTVAVRLRRDFGLIMTLVRAHALLHRESRETDDEGRIMATLSDYAAVRELVADLVADGVEATVPASVRETVETAKQLLNLVHADEGKEPTISLAKLSKALELDKSAASRRVRVAVGREYLHNLESKRGKPMRITAGDPMPDELEILPSVAVLQCAWRERHPSPPSTNGASWTCPDCGAMNAAHATVCYGCILARQSERPQPAQEVQP